MLEIIIPESEEYDEEKNLFTTYPERTLHLEHSLLSISKWESKWKIPYLDRSKQQKTYEQTIDYIRCMTLDKNVDPDIYHRIPDSELQKIQDYISDTMTATTFSNSGHSSSPIRNGRVTSELIYYWMSEYNIPYDICQKWHLNRLLTLINVCAVKNAPPKKMSNQAILNQNRKINAARRAKYHSRG